MHDESRLTISILCSDATHPVVPALRRWQADTAERGHEVALLFDKKDLGGGDMLFLVSCAQIIGAADRARFKNVLVLHASDLPKGRGWSPHIWQILTGANRITVSLMEAADPVDSGAIWLKTTFELTGDELLPEINEKLFTEELRLMSLAVENFGKIRPVPQTGDPGPYMRKRTPADSELDPRKTLEEQFNLLRTVDNERYPAFMNYRGMRYVIKIEKARS
jgi:methionyl-tRNA formyltransferase